MLPRSACKQQASVSYHPCRCVCRSCRLRHRVRIQHMLRLGWTLLVGSTLSAAAFRATPLARSPRPALVHTCGKPTAPRYAPPAPRVVMTFGDTVTELFGGIAAVLAVVAITQDNGDAVESQRATEASAEAADSPALARAEQALAEQG